MTFGEKLQKLRAGEGFSQDALAELLDVSRQAVSKWERDEAMPEAEKLVRISDQFSVTIDSMLRSDREIAAPAPPDRPPAFLQALGSWYARRGWLLGVPVALWGGWQLLSLSGKWGSVSQLVREGQMRTAQGILWLLFANQARAVAAAGLLLAGILWMLLGRRKGGGLRWYHAGWTGRCPGDRQRAKIKDREKKKANPWVDLPSIFCSQKIFPSLS